LLNPLQSGGVHIRPDMTGIRAEWTADADDSVGYCYPDFVDVVIHCYRFCFGLTEGDRRLPSWRTGPRRTEDRRSCSDARRRRRSAEARRTAVAPLPSDLATGDDGLMSGLRPICRDRLHFEGGRRCSWHLSFGSVRHPRVHRLGGPGPCHRDRRRCLKRRGRRSPGPRAPLNSSGHVV